MSVHFYICKLINILKSTLRRELTGRPASVLTNVPIRMFTRVLLSKLTSVL